MNDDGTIDPTDPYDLLREAHRWASRVQVPTTFSDTLAKATAYATMAMAAALLQPDPGEVVQQAVNDAYALADTLGAKIEAVRDVLDAARKDPKQRRHPAIYAALDVLEDVTPPPPDDESGDR